MQSYSTDFLQQFGIRLAQLIAPTIPVHQLQAALRQTIAEARSVSSSPPAGPVQQAAPRAPTEPRKIELVFVHDCRNHGCNRPQCVLCKHNPNKRCTGNFAHKYWVGDRLLAKCEGEIQVELIDAATGERVAEDLSGARVEACILDGNKYNTRCRELGEQKLEVLSECEVLLNQKTEPLLVATGSNNDADSPRVVLKFQGGMAVVPLRDMKVTESSESVLSGTKRPPFRLVVRAVRSNGRRLNIRPAVSEEFVVVTKRTKNLKKQEIPSLDDPISKLNHIGKETVKKLNELKASADEAQLDLALPPDLHRVTKVREFQQLARISEADGHMQQKLKQLLKLSKEKWDSACEHAKTAVQVDNRMRAWYMKNMSVGLLYTCTLGDVRPDCPVALVQNRKVDGADFMEVIPMEHQLPAQREQVHGTCQQAVRLWWEDSHPGWMIFTLGSKHFETLEQIIQYSQSDGGSQQAGVGPSSPAGSAVVRVLNSGHADYEEEVSARSEDSAGSGDAHERPATRMATRRAAGMSRASTQSLRRNSSVTHPGMGLAPNSLRSNSLGTSSLSLGPAPERGAEPGAPDTAQLINQLLAVYQANSAGSFQGFPQGQGPHRPAAMPSPGFDFRSEGRGADQGGSDRESRGGAASPAPGPAFNPFETHTAVPFSQAARLAPLTSMPGLPGVLPLNGVSSAWPASVPLAGDTGSSMLPMLMSLNASLLKHGSSLGSLNYLNDYLAGSLPAEAVLYQQQQQAQQAEQRQQSAPIPQQPRQQENGSSGGHDDVQPRHESAPVAGLPALGNGASYASSAALDDRAQHAQHSVTRAGQAQQAQQTPAASTSAAEGSAPETQQRLPAERHQAGASERQSSGAAPSESDQSRQDEPGDLHQPRKSVDARAQPSSLRTAPTQHGDERGQAESAQNRPPAGDQDASEPEHIMRLSASEAGLPQDARAAPQQPSKGQETIETTGQQPSLEHFRQLHTEAQPSASSHLPSPATPRQLQQAQHVQQVMPQIQIRHAPPPGQQQQSSRQAADQTGSDSLRRSSEPDDPCYPEPPYKRTRVDAPPGAPRSVSLDAYGAQHPPHQRMDYWPGQSQYGGSRMDAAQAAQHVSARGVRSQSLPDGFNVPVKGYNAQPQALQGQAERAMYRGSGTSLPPPQTGNIQLGIADLDPEGTSHGPGLPASVAAAAVNALWGSPVNGSLGLQHLGSLGSLGLNSLGSIGLSGLGNLGLGLGNGSLGLGGNNSLGVGSSGLALASGGELPSIGLSELTGLLKPSPLRDNIRQLQQPLQPPSPKQ